MHMVRSSARLIVMFTVALMLLMPCPSRGAVTDLAQAASPEGVVQRVLEAQVEVSIVGNVPVVEGAHTAVEGRRASSQSHHGVGVDDTHRLPLDEVDVSALHGL